MKVSDLMTKNAKTCGRGSNLAEVAEILWDGDCGALPVLDDENRVIGMISDRDICLAVATKGRLASEIYVGEVSGNKPLHSCAPDDDVRDALFTMQQQQVRRIPVINGDGKIEGILSISDVLLAGSLDAQGNKLGITNAEVISALKGICERRSASLNTAASTASAAQA